MTAAARAPHVILFPMPAQGHINPFTSIADYLTASGISVTLVHTARSHSLLSRSSKAKLGGHLNKYRIEVVPDAMPSDHKGQLTSDHLMASLPLMRQGLEDLLEKLMQGDPPSCMIMDSLLPWGHQVAVKYGLPRVEVWTCSASVFSMGYHFPEIVARGYLPVVEGSQEKTVDFIPGVSAFRIADMPKMFGLDDLQGPLYHFFRSVFQHSKDADRILVPTVHELESSTVDALRQHAGICIDPVGPLFPFNSSGPAPAASLLSEDSSCLTWLDQQEKSSVLYVSFGSNASVEEEEFRELALGLEASGERFLWVIRPGGIKGITGVEDEDILPEGFLARTQDRGLIISWAPQLAVLAHPAVGAFFTHCGWNSTLESLYMGVPMLGLPQGAEQNTNLKYIVQDWKVGRALVQQPGEKCDRSCVEGAVRAMMRGDEGTEARRRALEWREVAHEAIRGSSKANLQRLVDDLKHGKVKPRSSHQASFKGSAVRNSTLHY